MNKLWKILQYGYLVVGVIFLVEGILQWNKNKQQALFMFGFAIFITLIFFFKRNFRRKIEKRNQQR
ncbi:hypothetical protein [Tenacibaculum sp. IB213877]|uniref:hypothetical protein n=1 Tax=Tenacibaculum sp. IB213877 TaxID=3097351 RepID=UPI002A5AEABF|nr:hypothetical protein [Tenacibaculum sp. IB213877]MDY0780214.1 hypothetical protein [Tenacibaculum sp. IB213877]